MRGRLFLGAGMMLLVLLVGSSLAWSALAAPSKPVPGTVYTADSPVDTSQGKDITVRCPEGQHATGGGGYVFTRQAQTFLVGSTPVVPNGGSQAAPATAGSESRQAWRCQLALANAR